MKKIGGIIRFIIRFFVIWFVDTVSLMITAWLMPRMSFQPSNNGPVVVVATASALVLGIVNLIVRPLLLLIALPLGWMVVFAVGFFINAVTLMITASLVPELIVDSWWTAFLGGLVLAAVNTVLTTVLDIDDDNPIMTT